MQTTSSLVLEEPEELGGDRSSRSEQTLECHDYDIVGDPKDVRLHRVFGW